MTKQDYFSPVASQYAAFRPRYPRALFAWLATLTPGHQRAWDCACGSGQATSDLADHFDHVVGTDLSAEQLREATTRANIEYRVAVAEASGLPDASIDLITVAQALHWFDAPRFYAEARRVLKPDGVLTVWCYGVCTLAPEHGDALLQELYSGILGPYWPPERRHIEAGYRTLPFPRPELAVPHLAMVLEWSLEQLLGYLSSWSATNRYIQAHGRDPLLPFRAAIAPYWGDPAIRRNIHWPLNIRAAALPNHGSWDVG